MLQYLHLIDDSQVVVANPPYLGQKQYNKLQKQVKMYEDPAALLSGEDGLDLIRPLASHLAS
jgi:methylase of polypeptide subunit release factors